MTTGRPGIGRLRWRRPIAVRIVLIVLGALVIFVGYVAWALETEYGGDPDRQEYVVGQEAGGPVRAFTIGENGQEIVAFEGTQEEVDAFLERERGSRNYTVPALILAGGGIMTLLAAWPVDRKSPAHDDVSPPANVPGA